MGQQQYVTLVQELLHAFYIGQLLNHASEFEINPVAHAKRNRFDEIATNYRRSTHIRGCIGQATRQRGFYLHANVTRYTASYFLECIIRQFFLHARGHIYTSYL